VKLLGNIAFVPAVLSSGTNRGDLNRYEIEFADQLGRVFRDD